MTQDAKIQRLLTALESRGWSMSESLSLICPACRAAMDGNMNYCPTCGQKAAPTFGASVLEDMREALEEAGLK